MNQLIIDNKPWSYVLFGLGTLSLLAAFSLIAVHLNNLNTFYLVLSITFMLTGVTQMTNYFGTQKTFLKYDSSKLTIKWHNRITPYKIDFTEIENIYLQRGMIIIRYKSSKILKLDISIFSTEQKKELYEFFIKFSGTSELKLTRRFS